MRSLRAIIILLFTFQTVSNAAATEGPQAGLPPKPQVSQPLLIPSPPVVNAKAWILIDADSGKILAEKDSEVKLPPASLTKMMTLYVISNALHNEQIHLKDPVRISKDAWKTGGSRMFVKEGQEVNIQDLLKGIIVASGNDACVAMAEHLGGSESGFSDIMNQKAAELGMSNSHFTDSTGLPNENHYTTAKDLAILAQGLINNYPQYYHWYKKKWFSFNGIRQPNRNRLLWRNSNVDGLKTGHTNEAGFCLVASAHRDTMRLISVVLGAPNDTVRADDSERLLNYGFRFFETHAIYKANQSVAELPVYKGDKTSIEVGPGKPLNLTIPSGQYQRLVLTTSVPETLQAPIAKGSQVGELIVQFDGKVIEKQPLFALTAVETGGFYIRMKDSIRLMYKRWFG